MASSRKSPPSRDLKARVSTVIREHVRQGDRLIAGLSGGVDSMVLVDALFSLRGEIGFALAAVHVNHQLNPAAGRWASFCRAWCKKHGVPIKVIKVNVAPGASIENAARTARYAALASVPADFIVLAHNLDDQAETVFLQLLRGAGVKGVSAMPDVRILDSGFRSQVPGFMAQKSQLHRAGVRGKASPNPESLLLNPAILRPLLEIPREEIEAHARARKLAWIEDDSNANIAFDRNFMRHRILPVVAQRFPAYRQTLLRASRNFAEAALLLDELARADAGVAAHGLSIAAIRRLSVPRAKNVVRHFLATAGVSMPNATRLAECVRQLRQARAGRNALDLGEHELRCHAGELQVVRKASSPARTFTRAWCGGSRLPIPELGGTLAMTERRGAGISLEKFSAAAVTVRVRQGGERLRVHERRPRRSLKNLLQEAGIPPWLRERLPLVYCGDTLVYVPGIGIDVGFRARADEKGVEPAWLADTAAPGT